MKNRQPSKANLTSEQRAKAYQLLYQFNRSFHLIVRRLSEARAWTSLPLWTRKT